MSGAWALLALPLGLAIGGSLGVVGGGGSVLAVPVLVYVFGESVHEATTASLLVVAVGAWIAALGQARAGCVCWAQVRTVGLGTVAGSALGTALNRGAAPGLLLGLFAAVMVVSASLMWRRTASASAAAGAVTASAPCPPARPVAGGGAGVACGFATGLLGVGGGFVLLPLLTLGLRCPLKPAVGTSAMIIGIAASASFLWHLRGSARLDVPTVAALTLACAAGAAAGSAIGPRLSQAVLARGFALLVALVAVWTGCSALLGLGVR